MERVVEIEPKDGGVLFQEQKDTFFTEGANASTITSKDLLAAYPIKKKPKLSQCESCGWHSGGIYGENQHAWGCKNSIQAPPQDEPEVEIVDGPFTAESVWKLCHQIDSEQIHAGFYFANNTPQKYLNFFNQAAHAGGFESKESWWNGGFNYVFASKGVVWKENMEREKHYDLLFGAFQQFIAENMTVSLSTNVTRKTQKVRGIEKLNKFAHRQDGVRALAHLFVSNEQVKQIANAAFPEKDTAELYKAARSIAQKGKIFARCCPLTPRHGFTDSVFVSIGESWAEFIEALEPICAQMLADDPQAELILMQPCFAHFNIVTNEKAIVIGTGHDGATGGKDTLTFPVSKPFEFTPSEKASIGLDAESGVFCEYVGRIQKSRRRAGYEHAGAGAQGGFHATATYLTQLRGGPKIDVTGDYVPREVALDQEYLIPHKNPETGKDYKDTEWEKVINDVKKRDDWDKYFVWHPGGAISSHFGVHCFINEIPYITSEVRLNKKSILKPNATVRKANLEAFQRGFQKAPNLLPLITPAKGVELLLAALHNYPALDASDPKQAEMLGIAVEFAIHLGLATCLGESRYANRIRMDYFLTKSVSYSREFVYHRAQMFDLNYVLRKAHHRCPWFGVNGWGSSVGGLKWLECSEAVFELWNATCDLVQKGSKDSLGIVISQLNKVVNICHNAAKMLTKFTGSAVFDFTADRPNEAAFRITPVLFELLKADVEKAPIWFERFELPKAKWNADSIREAKSKRELAAYEKAKKDASPMLKKPTVPLSPKEGYSQCQSCGWYWNGGTKLFHHTGCPFKGIKMPDEVIKAELDCDQCQMCGFYVHAGEPQMHHFGCPIEVSEVQTKASNTCSECGYDTTILLAPHAKDCPEYSKNAASEAPSSYETENSDEKCGDKSCSSCYPNK